MRQLLTAFIALTLAAALLLAQPDDEADLVHTVGAGDTLISIAHAYGVTLEQVVTLNDLNPEALLQIGQRLVVIRAADFADDDPEPAADDGEPAAAEDESAASETAVGGNLARAELPPAPVADADAPMRDPADISAQLCFAVFKDDNHNGIMEPGEANLEGATIRLLDADDHERLSYTTDGAAEPHCARGLERRLYKIEGGAPPGYGFTSAARLRLDLREGGQVRLEFGAKEGLADLPLPPPEPPTSADGGESAPPRSLLGELSGLFALGLAAFVLLSGMIVSVFVRWR